MADHTEKTPLLVEPTVDDKDILTPISPKQTCCKYCSTLLFVFLLPIYIVIGIFGLLVFVIVTISCVGPLIEFCYAQRDKKLLDRENVLLRHPEMFLLEIPGSVNKASGGFPYKVMVRLTKPYQPSSPENHLPPIVMPGGLAANMIPMARHQDMLTDLHGFTVVNFDRLGVGFSDPNPTGKSPSARDVAHELEYILSNCPGVNKDEKWIQIGGSMGTNVATAFACLFPDRLCGFFNLDGLPPAFLPLKSKKFLEDGPQVAGITYILWTGIFRFMLSVVMRGTIIRGGYSKSFTEAELIASVLQKAQWKNTALEYATLMSCCDLELASWGQQATTSSVLSDKDLFILASIEPDESVIVDEMNGKIRQTTSCRAKSELGLNWISKNSKTFHTFWDRYRQLAVKYPEEIDKDTTHSTWPTDSPKHPVGVRVGGIEEGDVVLPLASVFSKLFVRVTTARDYAGLEGEYTQPCRNHAMARSNLHSLMAMDGKSYVYPELNHGNLWQQSEEIVRIAYEMALVIEGRAPSVIPSHA